MPKQVSDQPRRTLLAGKIVWNFGQSVIDCVVRNLSDAGACVQVESTRDVPDRFLLTVHGSPEQRPCKLAWQSDNRIGVSFVISVANPEQRPQNPQEFLRGRLLALRESLDEVDVGVVLLDAGLKAQFINKAFRRMWKLPDAKADAGVPFVALMYHGRDTRAYEVPADDLDDYVASRVELVNAGDVAPMDLRLTDGHVVRFQCAALPNGGRVLTYTYVTDIVRHSDRLKTLTSALDCVEDGVMLFDSDMRLEFINQKARRIWSIPEDESRLGTPLEKIMEHTKLIFDVSPDEAEALVSARLIAIRSGEPRPTDIKTIDGKTIRAHCTRLASGQRMLTYYDVTDLVRTAEHLQLLATTDSMTGLFNRRHFLTSAKAELDRFQRYHRPLTLLMLDIDHFKSVNDRFGHATGDDVIRAVARTCSNGKRASDVIGRLGGEEFAILLPETGLAEAGRVALRIQNCIAAEIHGFEKVSFRVTASIGIASATASMSGIDALMRNADKALYQAKANGRNAIAAFEVVPRDDLKNAAE